MLARAGDRQHIVEAVTSATTIAGRRRSVLRGAAAMPSALMS
jgi:hypothetical protein